jgi:pimeloyl-ACP methyl ester carboxylesterase
MPTFQTNDQTPIHYEDWGDGPPIVFVAAWALSSRMWQYQMVTLADQGFRTIAYDRRGHGRSGRPGSGYDYDTLADDLAGLMEHLDLDDVTLVTYSMGEGEAVRYLTRHGHRRIARLILACPLGPLPLRTDDNPNGFDPALVEAIRESWKQDFPAWMDANQDGFFGAGVPGCRVSAGIIEWTRRDMLDTSLRALIECNRRGTATDRRPDMAAVRVPTLIIQGDHDQSIPVGLSGQVAAGLISGSVLTVYENAPHALYLTHHDRLTADILEFAKH